MHNTKKFVNSLQGTGLSAVFSREIAEDKLTVTTEASVAPHTAVMYSELFECFVENAEFEPEDCFVGLCTMC